LWMSFSKNGAFAEFHGYIKSSLPREPVIISPTAIELVSDGMLPQAFDWRNVGGRSFVAADWNQHIPQYCGACWIHGTGSQLNDRIKILRNATFPDVMLARQVMANCVPAGDSSMKASLNEGGCFGGDAPAIYRYMQKHKLPDETCMHWTAENKECIPENICRNCKIPPNLMDAINNNPLELAKINMGEACFPVEHWIGYGVSEYGWVNGSVPMMKEIYARGPITCSMMADHEFTYDYSANVLKHEGVYLSDKKYEDTDHLVEVVGWGETSAGLTSWSVRNSWGTYWGDGGWFKIRRGKNDLLIEGDCSWAVPSFADLNSELQGKVLGDYMKGVTTLPKDLQPFSFASDKLQIIFGGNSVPAILMAVNVAIIASVALAYLRPSQGVPFRQPALLG